MISPIRVGAVIYDPKVAVIWDIIKDYFQEAGCPIDYVFYSNYELLVEALLTGHVHIAWNSPLAWVDAQRQTGGTCRAVAMRDTDRDRVTHLIVRRAGGVETLADLRGKTVATGARDSPQATLLPLHLLHEAGLVPDRDFTLRRFDLLAGKHGDHIGGELEALHSLQRGETAAAALLDLNWERWSTDGTVSPQEYRVLATTRPFDHCNFTVRADLPQADLDRWLAALFAMSYANPRHREMMDMEGLRAWLPGRVSGYADLEAATQEQHFFEAPHDA